MNSLYDILEVKENATTVEIKKAYYDLARKLHPDKNRGHDTGRFSEIAHAYEVLSSVKRRKKYDRTGETGIKSKADLINSDAIRLLCDTFQCIIKSIPMNNIGDADVVSIIRKDLDDKLMQVRNGITDG